MNDFLKLFIDPLKILKISWLNLKSNSLKLNKQTIELVSIGLYQMISTKSSVVRICNFLKIVILTTTKKKKKKKFIENGTTMRQKAINKEREKKNAINLVKKVKSNKYLQNIFKRNLLNIYGVK